MHKHAFRSLEKIVKGFANHRRIQILDLVDNEPELSVIEITEKLKINMKTASEHVRRSAIAGLLMKRSSDKYVRHKLTTLGKVILTFLRTLE